MKKMTFLACAAMLTSAIALNSCKSDDPIGSFEGDAEVVKTEFAISLPNNVAGNGAKHMPASTVQKDGTIAQFQGMKGIILIPFAKADEIISSDVRLGKNIHLGDIKTPGSATDTLGRTSRAKVYSDVAIPLSTASFLFYGVSGATGTKFQTGSLIPDTGSTKEPAAIKFELDSILKTTDYNNLMDASGNGGKLLQYLTNIANASDGQASPKLWREYKDVGDSAAYYRMFQAYSSLKDLSSFQVSRLLTDLYKSLKPLNTPIANAIKTQINNATYATIDGNDTVRLVITDFPQSAGIPEGAIGIKWVGASTNAFVKYEEADYGADRTFPTKYVYPAQLWYFGNSTIKTSNKSQKAMYDDTKTWEAIKAAYTDANAVNTLTRSVLMSDSVQYAVARFDVYVKLESSSLADNSEHAEGQATPVSATSGFPVTAIFVGGQKNVGFNFEPIAGTDYTIYDNIMSNAMTATTSYSNVNHTLVLETADTADVRIAVEMENIYEDFYGYGDQLIPKGSKFYVVATLGHAAATETDSKVFKQDFTTTAKLNLKNLKTAYNTIPDLRTPQLEIGFAVDLNWQSGHSYNDIDFE